MEVAFRSAALTHPGRGDAAVALHRAGHRPAHRLRRLRGKVAADGEEAVFAARIHDRQLAALQLVALVRVDLVDHFDQRVTALDQNALLAVAGKDHVIPRQCHRGRDAGRLLARALHVEAGLALPLPAEHAFVECARHRHVAEHLAQRVRVELGIPRSVRLVVITQNADQPEGEIAHFSWIARFVGSRGAARRGHIYMRKIDRVARPELGFGNMQRKLGAVVALCCTTLGPVGHRIVSQTQSYA